MRLFFCFHLQFIYNLDFKNSRMCSTDTSTTTKILAPNNSVYDCHLCCKCWKIYCYMSTSGHPVIDSEVSNGEVFFCCHIHFIYILDFKKCRESGHTLKLGKHKLRSQTILEL